MIKNKKQMYDLLKKGAFGNRFRIWETAGDLVESGYSGLLGVRCSGKRRGAPYYHHKTVNQSLKLAKELEVKGYTPVFYEASPDELITFQGEFDGLSLRGSEARTQMRRALARDDVKYLYGRQAEFTVRKYLNEASWEDMQSLLEIYPGHVVEFTAYSSMVGELKGRNTVIWEVRAY